MQFQTSNQFARYDQKVHIYSKALLSNLASLKGLCRPETKFCAVIKANGYGHGITEIVEILKKGRVDFFAVANVYEAAFIADIVEQSKILILEPIHTAYSRQAVQLCAQKGFHCAIVDAETLQFARQRRARLARGVGDEAKRNAALAKILNRLDAAGNRARVVVKYAVEIEEEGLRRGLKDEGHITRRNWLRRRPRRGRP